MTRAMFSGVSGMGSGSSSGGRPTGRFGRESIGSLSYSLGPRGFRFEAILTVSCVLAPILGRKPKYSSVGRKILDPSCFGQLMGRDFPVTAFN